MRKMRSVVPQACDACRRRKIKCNGACPCSGCLSTKLACTFKSPRGQGGNRGIRATVLNELRDKQLQDSSQIQDISLTSHSSATESEVPVSTVKECIDIYLDRIFPIVPLLSKRTIDEEFSQMEVSSASRQFMLAFCAYVINFGQVNGAMRPETGPAYSEDTGKKLIQEALRQNSSDRLTVPDHRSVFVSFFLYGAHAGLGNYRMGWFYLREATTLYTMLKVEPHSWPDERSLSCLFWVLLVSERAHGLRKGRPITLQITPQSPTLDLVQDRGLYHLALVFRPLDETFFALWNGSSRDCSKEWLLGLERDVRTAIPATLNLPNDEIANIRVSQLWVQIKLWELFPRFGFLSTDAVHECLKFRYPIVIAADLMILAMKIPVGSFQVHGIGMTEKAFDIACAVADVLPFITTPVSQLELGPVDYLTQTATLLAKLPGGLSKFMPLLLAKIKELRPGLVAVLCEAIQLPSGAPSDPMSPDTQFAYEEEVSRGLYADLRRVT